MDISAREAAQFLGISDRRVRQLAEEGLLSSRRLDGRQILVDRDSVDRRRSGAVERGRPLSCRSAWAIICLASGHPLPGLSASEQKRAEQRLSVLAARPPGYLRSRAQVMQMRAHPGVLERLRDDQRLVLSGDDAARYHRADIVMPASLDAYVTPKDARVLVAEFALVPSRSSDLNVVLKVVPFDVDIPRADRRIVSEVLCAIDLIDSGDERSVRAGRSLLERADRAARA